MPWRKLPKKDAIGRDSRRVGANNLLSGGFRMGQPPSVQALGARALHKNFKFPMSNAKFPIIGNWYLFEIGII